MPLKGHPLQRSGVTALQLTDSMYSKCKESYERTMEIVGSGMAEVEAYLAQNVVDTEALLGVENP